MKNTLGFLLESNNIKPSELAKDLGVTRQTIHRALTGKEPSLTVALKIAKYFNKDVSDIFFNPYVKQIAQRKIN